MKDDARAQIFVLSCEILNSIDVDDLAKKLQQMSANTDFEEALRWHAGFFDEFIDLENSIFEKIGVDASARSEIAEYMARARAEMGPSATTGYSDYMISGINHLQTEVCRLGQSHAGKDPRRRRNVENA